MIAEDLYAKAAQIFLNAAEYIRQYGWQEKGMGKYGEPRCSMGALASVYPKEKDSALPELMYKTLYKELNGITLTEYNHKFQDGKAVAKLFEKTALSLTKSSPSTHSREIVN